MYNGSDKVEDIDLCDVIEVLTKRYLGLDQLCAKVSEHIEEADMKEQFADYIHYSRYFVDEIREFTNGRRVAYIPYVLELAEKSDTGHNCDGCSGSCDMQHMSRLFELNKTIERVLSASEYALAEMDAIYTKEGSKKDLLPLNNEVVLTGNILKDILRQELLYLVPKIKEAQKNINAGR
jgi:hypothetical protein